MKKTRKTATKRRKKQAPAAVLSQTPAPPQLLLPLASTSFYTFAEVAPNAPYNPNAITTFAELQSALQQAQAAQLTLANDIVISEDLTISHDVAINFAGHSLISGQSHAAAHVITIRSGEVTLTGRGKIFAMGKNSVAVRVFGAISPGFQAYTRLIIDEKIHLFAPSGTGLLVASNLSAAYGLSLRFSGEITARDGISLSEAIRGQDGAFPKIEIRSGARIIADEEEGTALRAAGLARWQIGAARLSGQTGIFVSAGELRLTKPQIIATSAALITPETSEHPASISISGGNYLSEDSPALVAYPSAFAKFLISGGVFCGAEAAINPELADHATIKGGEFTTDPAAILENPEFLLATAEPFIPVPNPLPLASVALFQPAPAPVPAEDPVSSPASAPMLIEESMLAEEPAIEPMPIEPEPDDYLALSFSSAAATAASDTYDDASSLSDRLARLTMQLELSTAESDESNEWEELDALAEPASPPEPAKQYTVAPQITAQIASQIFAPRSFACCLIDESAPITKWSTGVTMIDELTPVHYSYVNTKLVWLKHKLDHLWSILSSKKLTIWASLRKQEL